MKDQIKKIQEFVKVTVDGDFGSRTTSAVAKALLVNPTIKSIQKAVGVKDDGELGPITINAIFVKFDLHDKNSDKVEKLISIFKTQLGIKEISKNRGPGIEKYWDATTYKSGYLDRQPYCAACLAWIVRESDIFTEKERPKSARAFDWEDFARNCDKVKFTKNPKSIKRGDIVIFSFSHIGLAISDSDKIGDLDTYEANTGPSGGRDGDGIYEKSRNIVSIRSSITIL